MKYLIDGILVADQPMIVAGPQKSLKTSLLLDLAISLSCGGHFLGMFPVNRRAKVAFMCGESGMATIRETCIRITEKAGVEFRDLSLIFSPDLPRFDDAHHHDALGEFLTADAIEVLILDPAYLCMPGDNAGLDVELIYPIAMEQGLRFAIREGGRTVGAGVVSKVIK